MSIVNPVPTILGIEFHHFDFYKMDEILSRNAKEQNITNSMLGHLLKDLVNLKIKKRKHIE